MGQAGIQFLWSLEKSSFLKQKLMFVGCLPAELFEHIGVVFLKERRERYMPLRETREGGRKERLQHFQDLVQNENVGSIVL